MITFDNVSKAYGRQTIIDKAAFHLSAGDRVGVVGPNGAGKTTLFRLIIGLETPDQGAIHRTRGLNIGHLPQEVGDLGDEPLLETVMATAQDIQTIQDELEVVAAELAADPSPEELETLTRRQSLLLERFESLDGYTLQSRAEKILEGLGFSSRDFSTSVSALSGGWRMRALLARILLADPDLILLDEPTNHLDLGSMLWLERYLTDLTATVMIVSHDRAFLNRTVTKIVELDGGTLTAYAGDYDRFEREKAQRLAHLEAAYRQQQQKIRQMRQFIDRNRSRKDRARQVQARLKALEKMERIEPPRERREFDFSFPQPSRPPAVLVGLEGVGLNYGGDKPVYPNLSLTVGRGDRIALVGPNGAGKSTLLKLLAGELEPTAGRRRVPGAVKIAYFAQHQLEQLNPSLSVIEELMSVSGDASQTQLRTLLGSFLFSGDDVFKKVSVLSGGERSRLALAKLLFSGANLLLLDEPTNHLDIPSRIALEEALKAWPGEVCLVTHDRRLINAVANRIWEVKPGGEVTVYPGNLDDYVATWRRLTTEPGDRGRSTPADKPRPAKSRADKDRKRRQAEWRQRVSRETAPLKKRLAEIEAQATQTEAELERLTVELADPACYADPDRAARLNRELAAVRAELEDLNERWAEVALELEELTERLEAEREE